MEERAARIRQLRKEIEDQAAVAQKLPEGHPARTLYLDQIEEKAHELAYLEQGQSFGVYIRACGLVSVGALVASSGVWTGILLGGLLGSVALCMVLVHGMDR